MSIHMFRELERLNELIICLASIVEQNLVDAIKAVETSDEDLAENVIAKDEEIDKKEIDIEEEALKMLALYQPVAQDLRYIVAIIKINNDMERVGDLSVNVAKRVKILKDYDTDKIEEKFKFGEVSRKALSMFKKSVEALTNMDAQLARQVIDMDDELDALITSMYDKIKKRMENKPNMLTPLLHFMHVYRHLERVGDQATNIAEETIYLKDGVIVRHGGFQNLN